jgi:putative transposase
MQIGIIYRCAVESRRRAQKFFQGPDGGFPNFKRKRRDRDSCAANRANNNIRAGGQYIALPKAGRVRIKKHGGAPGCCRLKSCTAIRESSGKRFASVLYEYGGTVEPAGMHNAVGLDLSMKEHCISSGGRHGEHPRQCRRARGNARNAV